MRCIRFFIILSLFFIAEISTVQLRMINSYIANFEEEIELFKDRELWFPDGDGNPVKALLEPVNTQAELFFEPANMVVPKLYTRKSQEDYDILKVGDFESLKKSRFNPMKPTRIIVHGWQSSPESRDFSRIRKAYLEREDCNVIAVDWRKITRGPYSLARTLLPSVGEYIGSMIDFLEENGMNLRNTSLVGHSLGAHVVGLAGHRAKNEVKYIVGLDPAWPLFAYCDTDCRITNLSAEIVEIIHTNGGFLGNPHPIGDLDFFPNGGGLSQPGCDPNVFGMCAHSRAIQFFAESILTKVGFYGIKCGTREFKQCDCRMEIMGGINPSSKKSGIYYLETRQEQPFALGRNVIRKL